MTVNATASATSPRPDWPTLTGYSDGVVARCGPSTLTRRQEPSPTGRSCEVRTAFPDPSGAGVPPAPTELSSTPRVSEVDISSPELQPAPPAFRIINPRTDLRWDTWLEAFPDATVFHTAAWAAVLEDTYGFKPVHLAFGDPDAPTALLPVMECSSLLTGRRGVSLPFTDHVAPLIRDRGTTGPRTTDRGTDVKSEGRKPKAEGRGTSDLELRTPNFPLRPSPSPFPFGPPRHRSHPPLADRRMSWRHRSLLAFGPGFAPFLPAHA
ncbi:MAG: hypothetical protein M5U12_08980 [Verrucomicrobia bacterium]|nr:hypothetical protein [Verrucomicrobiota bacterium]